MRKSDCASPDRKEAMTDDIERSRIPSSLEPAHPHSLTTSDLIVRALESLPILRSASAIRRIQRGRAQLAVDLSNTQNDAMLAEARVIARAKVRSTEEQIERMLHAERLDCLAESALKHDEASRLIDLVKDEVAHSLFKDALNGASARYASGVIRRSDGSGN
jgi:hypothetical protein